MIQRWLAFTLQLVVAVLAVGVVTLATQLRSNTAFTGASLVALMTFGDSLAHIIKFYTLLETSIGAVSRLKAFNENVKSENKEGEDMVPPREWPLQGAIEIDGVSAAYGSDNDNGTTTPDHLALNDLHLAIAPSEKVALCGRSGRFVSPQHHPLFPIPKPKTNKPIPSGKSSLLLLLLRLLDPVPANPKTTEPAKDSSSSSGSSGTITIDSLPLHALSRPHLRNRLLALPQDPVFLPPGTPVRTNLDPHHAASETDCRAALETVALWPFVAARGGLSAPLSPDTLSQGQKQLFSLARVILRRRIRAKERAVEFGVHVRDGGVLLLDEVSSSVDRETDEAMQRVIMDEFAGYTIVMVSHRLGMVMGFDRVVVMDAGRIVETGRPGDLVEVEGGRFRELWMVGDKGKS